MSNELRTDWADTAEIPNLDPTSADGAPTKAYYDVGRKDFWTENDRKEWMPVSETALRRFLKADGFSGTTFPGEMISRLDLKLNEIQRKFDVAFAGPLAGHPVGAKEMCGNRILVTSAPRLIEPKAGDWPLINILLSNLFHDPLYDQTPHVLGWMKVAYEALRVHQLRPGQALVMAGQRDAGKSILQSLITQMFGGRVARPYREMTGGTNFNSELFGAEHLIIEDDAASTDIRKRLSFGAKIKDITVNSVQSHHAKNRPAISLQPFWRLSISLNSEAENLMVLPPIEESLEDKLILLKTITKPMPMPTHTDAERALFWNALVAELPAFLWDLERWVIPTELKSARFGVVHYHHPELLNAIGRLSPENRLLELIDEIIWADFPQKPGGPPPLFQTSIIGEPPHQIWTAAKLESCLINSPHFGHEAKKFLHWQNATGTYLGRLANKYPDRIKNDRDASSRNWLFYPPVTPTPMTP